MNVLLFIDTEGYGSTEPSEPNLSSCPDIYSNVSVHLVARTHQLGRYFNACNVIINNNMMQKYDLALHKYQATKSGYFRLATAVELGMGITYGELLFYHGI